ncbi:MAG: hypothetical protein KDK70_11665 [Myxococcales bacterium]|nr:hypothetical protein [Myxococcales bacterium]
MPISRLETVFVVAGSVLPLACEGPARGDVQPDVQPIDDSGPPQGSTGTSTAMETGPGAATGSSSSGPGDPIFDVGAMDLPPVAPGCRKADFLFVIDDSGSMAEHQQQLLDSFPGFIDAILGTLADLDSVHVGVVTSDAYAFNAPGCQELGAMVTQTGGADSSQAICTPFVGGKRFFTEEDSLAAAFNCVGRVGTDGSGNELPLSAAVRALQPELVGVGGCNEGFLRPDAILVVVIVTDDPPFPDTPDDAWPLVDVTAWHDAIVEAKGGNEEAIAMIGVVSWGDDRSCVCPWCCPGWGCEAPNVNAIELVQSFGDHGVLTGVCADDYSPVLAQTIETIDVTCAVFDPSE